MTLSYRDHDSVIEVAGPLDVNTAATLRDALEPLVDREPAPTLDLSGIDSCDTAGIQVLFAAARSAAFRQKRLRVANASAPVVHLLDALGLPADLAQFGGSEPLPENDRRTRA